MWKKEGGGFERRPRDTERGNAVQVCPIWRWGPWSAKHWGDQGLSSTRVGSSWRYAGCATAVGDSQEGMGMDPRALNDPVRHWMGR